MHFFNRRTSQAAKKPARTEGYGLQPVHKWLRINRALQAAEKRPPWRFVTVVHWLRRPARNETNVLRFVFVLFNLQRFWAEGAGAFRPLNAALLGAAFRPGPSGVTCISVSFYGTTSFAPIKPIKSMGFTGCGKTRTDEGYGLQPVHKSLKNGSGFTGCGKTQSPPGLDAEKK